MGAGPHMSYWKPYVGTVLTLELVEKANVKGTHTKFKSVHSKNVFWRGAWC